MKSQLRVFVVATTLWPDILLYLLLLRSPGPAWATSSGGFAFVRMRWHPATLAYTKRRLAEGKTKAEITRCYKCYVAREAFRHVLHRSGVDVSPPAA